MRRRFDFQIRRESQTALHHPGLDVVDKVLRHCPAIPRFEADCDGETVARRAGPTKRGE